MNVKEAFEVEERLAKQNVYLRADFKIPEKVFGYGWAACKEEVLKILDAHPYHDLHGRKFKGIDSSVKQLIDRL